ncbi:MAG TPA: hypothetical protein VJQ56_05015, partial [Blastocatellia bacterium]|nr:hypothetical protein [Blastocatellia bacterium]
LEALAPGAQIVPESHQEWVKESGIEDPIDPMEEEVLSTAVALAEEGERLGEQQSSQGEPEGGEQESGSAEGGVTADEETGEGETNQLPAEAFGGDDEDARQEVEEGEERSDQ